MGLCDLFRKRRPDAQANRVNDLLHDFFHFQPSTRGLRSPQYIPDVPDAGNNPDEDLFMTGMVAYMETEGE